MLVRIAGFEHMQPLLAVAAQVGPLFGVPELERTRDFREFLERKIGQGEALVALDRRSGRTLGFLCFSRRHNRISFLAVDGGCRRRGVGSRLLGCALSLLDAGRPCGVTTFCQGHPGGEPARALYRAFGFRELEPLEHLGLPRAYMERPAGTGPGTGLPQRGPLAERCNQDPAYCPACRRAEPGERVAELAEAYLDCPAGGPFGRCILTAKEHQGPFYAMEREAYRRFMEDAARAARALQRAAGAVSVKLELGADGLAHPRACLTPLFVDDAAVTREAAGRAADDQEAEAERLWLLQRLREALEEERRRETAPV